MHCRFSESIGGDVRGRGVSPILTRRSIADFHSGGGEGTGSRTFKPNADCSRCFRAEAPSPD
jgi:hypothetical protein